MYKERRQENVYAIFFFIYKRAREKLKKNYNRFKYTFFFCLTYNFVLLWFHFVFLLLKITFEYSKRMNPTWSIYERTTAFYVTYGK